jgi:hypothetical protein
MRQEAMLILSLVIGCGERSLSAVDGADSAGADSGPSHERTAWAVTTGGPGASTVLDMVVDPAGNAFIVGELSGRVRFGSIEKGAGDEKVFVARLSPGGDFRWVLTGTGAPTLVSYTSVALDPQGQLYVAGVHQGAAHLGDRELPFRTRPALFVARLTTEGRIVWLRSFSGPGAALETIYASVGLAPAGPAGGVVVTGGFEGTLILDGHTLVDKGQGDLFVASLSAEGACRWAISSGGAELDYAGPVATDPEGAITIAGRRSPDGHFVARLSAGGLFQWVAKGQDIWGLATAGPEIVAAGNFGGEIVLGDTILKAPNGQLSEILVARLSSQGAYTWAVGGGDTDFYDLATDVTTDAAGASYVTGMAGEQATLGPLALTGRNQFPAFYVAKLSPKGQPLWTEAAVGAGQSEGRAVVVNGGSLWSAGLFEGRATLGPHTLESQGARRLFVWRQPLPD